MNIQFFVCEWEVIYSGISKQKIDKRNLLMVPLIEARECYMKKVTSCVYYMQSEHPNYESSAMNSYPSPFEQITAASAAEDLAGSAYEPPPPYVSNSNASPMRPRFEKMPVITVPTQATPDVVPMPDTVLQPNNSTDVVELYALYYAEREKAMKERERADRATAGIAELEAEMFQLKTGEIFQLKNRIAGDQKIIVQQEQTNRFLSRELEGLRQKYDRLQADNQTLCDELALYKDENIQLRLAMSRLHVEIASLRVELNKKDKKNKKK